MPQLPDISYGAVGIAQPDGQRPLASADLTGTGKAVANLGNHIGDIAASLKEKQDNIDYTYAKSNYLTAAVQAQKDEELNPDYAGAPQRFQQTMDVAAKASAEGINNPTLKKQFLADQGLMTRRIMGEVMQGSIAKFKSDGLAKTNDLNEVQTNIAANTTSDAVATSAITNIQNNNVALEKAGVITSEQRFIANRKAVESISLARGKTLVLGDPASAFDLLKPASQPGAAHDAITQAAQASGADADTLAKTAILESGGNPNAVNGKSQGLFQFQPGTAKRYGVTNPLDAAQSAAGAAKLQNDNTATLSNALGRAPTPDEVYLAHQQGAGGAAALLNNPDKNAVDALTGVYGSKAKATAAITGNGGTEDMTAAQFSGMWKDKFDKADTSQITGGKAPNGVIFPKQGDWRDFIPPEQRMQLLETAMTRSIALENQAAAKAERNLKLAQTSNESTVFSDLVAGKDIDQYDLPTLLKNQQISVSGYNALMAEKKRTIEGTSDPVVLVHMQSGIANGAITQDDIYDALRVGKIGGKDALELTRAKIEADKTGGNQLERGSFRQLQTALGADAIEKGIVDFSNEAGRARVALWGQAQGEYNNRVFVNKENPQEVVNDMLPRYQKAVPDDTKAWPNPRYAPNGQISTLADVAAAAKATADALHAGKITDAQSDSEAALLAKYAAYFQNQQKQKAAAQVTNQPGGAKLRGITPEAQ